MNYVEVIALPSLWYDVFALLVLFVREDVGKGVQGLFAEGGEQRDGLQDARRRYVVNDLRKVSEEPSELTGLESE